MQQNSSQPDDLHTQLAQLDKDALVQLITQVATENTIVRWEIINLLRKFTVSQVASEDADYQRTAIHLPQTIAAVNRKSTAQEKIKLFKSLFRGRDDVFALRWQNVHTAKSGYSPVCKNKFSQGKCDLRKIPCASCSYREMLPLNNENYFNHLRGASTTCSDVIGLYPLLTDSTCFFLALDFDEADWRKDVSAVRQICADFDIPASVEISRSGNGAHIWFFFENAVTAKVARTFGELLLHAAMSVRHEMSFKSFDRMFPNQDTLPLGGYGNLIALPLQGRAVQENHSVFVDENFIPYPDQWAYLSSLTRLTQETLTKYIQLLAAKIPDGNMIESETAKTKTLKSIYSVIKQFENAQHSLSAKDFPAAVEMELSNMIHIKKHGISELALGILKRLAVFHNPEFYRAQKMRLPIYNKPRYIDCSEENMDVLSLPRGCLEKATAIISDLGVSYNETDNRNKGVDIDVNFTGTLNENQNDAFSALTRHENGILSAGTGFGKTVIATKIIAQHKVNTLVIVHTNALLTQWQSAIKKFLNFEAGTIGSGKDNRTGKIDIAIIRSLIDSHEKNNPCVKEDIVKNYGMIIVDECHHVSAFSFEIVLKAATAKFVYGLTATPIRRDGHEPILFMQCGDIRYKTDARQLANEHGFAHYIVPRFMPFAIIDEATTDQLSKYYEAICTNSERNKIIAGDIRAAVQNGRTPIILSERVSHITELKELLGDAAKHVVLLTGKGTAKQKREVFEQLSHVPANESLIVLATGKYAGEGFDIPRLDTLFLAMPISWNV